MRSRIAFISTYPPRGNKHAWASGVASYVKNLVTNFPPGHELIMLCQKDGPNREEYVEDGIKIIRCFDRQPIFVRQVYKEIKQLNPDVIHIQQELSLFGSILTAYLLRWLTWLLRKYYVIITLHGVVSLKRVDKDFVKQNNSSLPAGLVRVALKAIYKPLATRPRQVIVHEEYFKHILTDEYGAERSKVKVIYHGVENFTALPERKARRALKIEPGSDTVLFMGYLTGYKGLDLLIEGFSNYAAKNPTAYLIIGAGKHPKLLTDKKYLHEYQRLQAKARQLIKKSQYRWVGFIEEGEIAKYYSAGDVSIYPYTVSIASSGPMSFAIGFEKPFLASTAFADIFAGSPVHFERNPEALLAKLEYFFNHQKEFKQISSKLKNERLWSVVARQTLDLYKELS